MTMNNMPNANSSFQQPQPPSAVSQAPAPLATMPSKGIPPKVLAIIVLGIVLTLGIPGFFILNVHGGGGGLFVDKHGMPGNVPLPNGATFKSMADLSSSRGTAKAWYWTVDSPNTPTVLKDFYESNLSSNGWTNVEVIPSDTGGYGVYGCNGKQGIYVILDSSSINFTDPPGNTLHTATAPAGGSAMRIQVSSQSDILSAYGCK